MNFLRCEWVLWLFKGVQTERKKINFTPFDDLSPSDHMFNLALKSPMTVVRKGLLLKSHPDLFQSLSESHENHPEID